MSVSSGLSQLATVSAGISDDHCREAIQIISSLIAQIHCDLLLKVEREVDLAVSSSLRRRALESFQAPAEQNPPPTLLLESQALKRALDAAAADSKACDSKACNVVSQFARQPSASDRTSAMSPAQQSQHGTAKSMRPPWEVVPSVGMRRIVSCPTDKSESANAGAFLSKRQAYQPAPPRAQMDVDAWSPLPSSLPCSLLGQANTQLAASQLAGAQVCNEQEQACAEGSKLQTSESFPLWMQLGFASVVEAHAKDTPRS